MWNGVRSFWFSIICIGFALFVSAGAKGAATISLQERFDAVLRIMDENSNGRISDLEIKNFLISKRPILEARARAQLKELGYELIRKDNSAPAFARIMEKEATNILDEADGNGGEFVGNRKIRSPWYGIEAHELDLFLRQKLSPPFSLAISELLPEDNQETKSEGSKEKTSLVKQVGQFVSLRKGALIAKDISKPATINFTHLGSDDDTREAGKDRNTFKVDGALIVHPCQNTFCRVETKEIGNYYFDVDPFIAIDADVSTNRKANEDNIIHHVGGSFLFTSKNLGSFIRAHNFDLTADYTTGREYSKDILGYSLQYTPNIPKLLVGASSSIFGTDDIKFMWRPFLKLNYGDVRDAAGNEKLVKQGDFLNLSLDAQTKLRIGKYLIFSPSLVWARELNNDEDNHFLYSLSARFLPTGEDTFSIQASYTDGEKAPSFSDVQLFEISFGLKF